MFLKGSSKDGWDARPVEGMYVSPDGKEWGSAPYTAEDRAHEKAYKYQERLYKELSITIESEKDLKNELELINKKKSQLSCRLRKFVVILCQIREAD